MGAGFRLACCVAPSGGASASTPAFSPAQSQPRIGVAIPVTATSVTHNRARFEARLGRRAQEPKYRVAARRASSRIPVRSTPSKAPADVARSKTRPAGSAVPTSTVPSAAVEAATVEPATSVEAAGPVSTEFPVVDLLKIGRAHV